MFSFFERLVDPYPPAPPVVPPRGFLPFVMHYSRPMLPLLVVIAVLTAMVSVVEIAFFDFMGSLVDWLGATDRESMWDQHGHRLLLMAALVVLGHPLLVFTHSLLLHQGLFGNYPMRIRWLAHRHLLGQSLGFFQDEFAGRVGAKVMQSALAIRETVIKLLDVFVYVAVYFIGTAVLVGRADGWMVLPLLGWLAGYITILAVFVPRLQRIGAAQADARAEMTGRIVDSYTNIQTVKLFAHSRREEAYARDAMQGFMDTVHRQMRMVTWLNLCLHSLNGLLLGGIGALAIFAWQAGSTSLGAVAVAIALVLRIRGMSEWILWEVAGLFENIGTVQDGMNTLTQPPAVVDVPGAPALAVSRGGIRFEAVKFHYGERVQVFDGLDLHIQPGEKVGIVGRSGAGKSTLVNLLLRFYDVNGGRILIDGQDIATVSQESLRQAIGMVTQDTSLLHRSIRDNIAYGRPDADQAAVERAARQAHADAFIPDLVDAKGRRGHDAHVGERGVKLSGGQRQRIAIARVLLKDAPILVLDEATSALDSEVEAAIQEQLYTLMEGKTVIAIAHRLSTIAVLDRLVVMDGGRIVESGSHEELLRANGLYAALWRRQSGGFLGVDPEAPPAQAQDSVQAGPAVP
ncbi:ATP-binding cassette domain-containing protein [Pseudofulvimonas gallinarii]|uniref:ATP-binding cassette domain-containing protein n=1 Tax=Pseudofulvimonas gallinarii TaxID=634155 RepID=UPI00197D388F